MTEDDQDEEQRFLAILKPCVDGPATTVGKELMLRPDGAAMRYASCRAVIAEFLKRRTYPTNGPSKLDRQAELLNRLRTTRGKLNPDHARRTLRDAFSDLSDRSFDAATCAKPAWRIRERAKEMRGVQNLYPASRLDSDDGLISDQR